MLLGIRLSSLVALLFSSAAAVEYYASHGGHGAFCAHGSGCDAVRHSAIGEAIGQGLPVVGVVGFSALLLLSFAGGPRTRIATLCGALTAGLTGAVLLALQAFAIGRYCYLCVGADVAAALAGAFALAWSRRPSPAAASRYERGAFMAAAVLAIGGPYAWAASAQTAVPSYVEASWQSGKINVVEVSDFECPFCRAMHPHLSAAMADFGERIHFVRKTFPLPGHLHARDAARAYLCADAQGRGEAMADALFRARDLRAYLALGESVGADRDRLAACVKDSATDRKIDDQMTAIREGGFDGLPTVWIDDQRILGFDRSRGADPYRRALTQAQRAETHRASLMPWAVTLALSLCAFALGSRTRLKPS